MKIIITKRQHATVLAALRCWQSNAMRGAGHDCDMIATNCDEFKALNADEIDLLCEKINT